MEDYIAVPADSKLKELLNTIFTDEFMQQYTEFENFEAFQYSSAVMTNWNAPQMIYSKTVFDNFVKESTEFFSWDEMVKTAAQLKFNKR